MRPAVAGPNEGGVLIVNTDPAVEYTTGVDYCALFDLESCEDAFTNLPASDVPHVWWVTAAFPPGSMPRLAGIAFGVQYDPDLITVVDFETCGDLEITSDGWPEPPSGTGMVWFDVQTSLLVPAYFFAGYAYEQVPTSFAAVPHPTQGGVMADDGVPAVLDDIAAYGSLGFHTDPGSLPCPVGVPIGACCLDACTCVVTTEESCNEQGGVWEADAPCSLDECGCPPSACCFEDGSCIVTTEAECVAGGGEFRPNESCSPNPCPGVLGACCLPDGSCQETTRAECETAGGFYRGDLTSCTIPCPEQCDPLPPRPGPSAQAGGGPHAGGVLIVHHNPEADYSSGDLCAQADLEDCASAVTRTDLEESIFYVLAAFPSTASPRLTGVDFGIEYSSCIQIVEEGHCGDIEGPDAQWPASGSGTGVGWLEAQTDHLVEVHWFLAYIEPGLSGEFAAAFYFPGYFYDDSHPPQQDPIADYGVLGFRTDGYLPCPDGPAGACCLVDGTCMEIDQAECERIGGVFQGPKSSCEPNPCVPVAVQHRTWGAIKHSFRE